MSRSGPRPARRSALLLVLGVLFAGFALGDVLLMKDGRRIEGTIAKETDAEVVIDTRFGRLTFPTDEIREIERGKTPTQEFDERWKEAKTAADFYELGQWADGEKLKSKAKKCMRKVVQLDADHEGANTWLGFVKYKGQWMTPEERDQRKVAEEDAEMLKRGLVRHGDRWVTVEEKAKLDAGLTYHDGRWLTADELKEAQGWRKYDGEWREAWRADALIHATKVVNLGGVRGDEWAVTGANVCVAGPFPADFLDEIYGGLDRGREWFDSVFDAKPGLELLGGRLAEFYVWGRDSEPYFQTVDYLVSLTDTVPEGWGDAVKRTHGYMYWDPYCVSSARAWGRPEADVGGHSYHHWGHLLLNRHRYDGRLQPPWFGEGFASLMEYRIHGENRVFCIAKTPPVSAGGGTAVKRVEYTFDSKEFRRGVWRETLIQALEAKDPRIASFDKLAQKQIGELTLVDIAMAMGVVDWLEHAGDGALDRFHGKVRDAAPPAPQRVHIKGIDRQGRYDAAFQAAVKMKWREADQAWRKWFLENRK